MTEYSIERCTDPITGEWMARDVLRRAATKTREAAEQATPDVCPSYVRDVVAREAREHARDCEHVNAHTPDCSQRPNRFGRGDEALYALWTPDVALAVADWLDAEAGLEAPSAPIGDSHAERVALAILGEDTTP